MVAPSKEECASLGFTEAAQGAYSDIKKLDKDKLWKLLRLLVERQHKFQRYVYEYTGAQ